MAASAVVDLPEPDSPTIATVSPGMTVRWALRTALTSPLLVVNPMARSLISSSGRSVAYSASWKSTEALMVSPFIACGLWDRGHHAGRRPA